MPLCTWTFNKLCKYLTGKQKNIIQANNKEITQILTKVKETTNHSQWETLLRWSLTAASILNIMLRPIVILFILIAILLFLIVFLYCKLVSALCTVQGKITEAKVMAQML